MAEKEFTIDVDAMLDMQVKRAAYLARVGDEVIKLAKDTSSEERPIPAAVFGLDCLKTANAIERGVMEDYYASRNIGNDASPDLHMIAEYLAEHHADELEEGQSVGQAAVKVLKKCVPPAQ